VHSAIRKVFLLAASLYGLAVALCCQPATPVPSFEQVGTGFGLPIQIGDVVTLHFEARSEAGRVLASTRRRGMPFRFIVGDDSMPPGFQAMLIGMKAGTRRSGTVSYEYLYGSSGFGTIVGPRTNLDISIEVLQVARPEPKNGESRENE
jgi:FKBP-type peptidyl-prolyl cis-trans isomerase